MRSHHSIPDHILLALDLKDLAEQRFRRAARGFIFVMGFSAAATIALQQFSPWTCIPSSYGGRKREILARLEDLAIMSGLLREACTKNEIQRQR